MQSVALGAGSMLPVRLRVPALTTSIGFNRVAGGESRSDPKPDASSPPQFFAHATDFEDSVAYRPAKRPGYCSWVTVWKGHDGSIFLNFCERTRRTNPIYRPIPLDFWEGMSLPIKYQSQLCTYPDILPETVILRSQDQGQSWKEVGRSILIFEPFAFVSLPDGSILRGIENAYTAYYANEKVRCTVQKSTDLGSSWTDISRLEDDFYFSPYRMKVLRDGTIGMLGISMVTFGPGRTRRTRGEKPAYIQTEVQAAFLYSSDQGSNWEGPVMVLPGVAAWEPDWVELASGDLLVVNCDVQQGANTRQVIKRMGKRFVPQPVLEIVRGKVPETLVVTKEGLLVGTRRGGAYTCSNDMGKTWYEIGGLPHAMYQPRIIQLDDGVFLSVAHLGGDNFVGEIDQYIGQHKFHLEEALPKPTVLDLTRERNAARTQYINGYTATLTVADHPVPDKEINFTVRSDAKPRRGFTTDVFSRHTDESGQAHLTLPEYEKCIYIHRHYTVQAEFSPAAADTTLAPAISQNYAAYRVNSTAGKKNTYAFYASGRTLFAQQDMLTRFPEIPALVKALGLKSHFSQADLEQELKIDRDRSKLLVETLLQHNVLQVDSSNSYSWNDFEVDKVAPITIDDDFIA